MQELDYLALGKRIRAERKRQHVSQEQLAEAAGVSTQHISNAERATTKISLPALVKICNALHVTPDEVLCDSSEADRASFEGELAHIVADCSQTELRVVTDTAKAVKESLRRRL